MTLVVTKVIFQVLSKSSGTSLVRKKTKDEIQNINECEMQTSNHSKKPKQNSPSDLSNGKLFDSDDSKC